MREPGASPGRSRRCEGRSSPADTPLARRAGKAAGGGAPSQKTCRSPLSLDPLAEGRRRSSHVRSTRPRGGARRPRAGTRHARGRRTGAYRRGAVPRHGQRGQREGHDPQAAGPDRLALADRHRDAVRDRRRPAGRGGGRAVGLPAQGAADDALRLHAERRGNRRVETRPRRDRVRPEGALGRARPPRDPGRLPERGPDAARRVPADPPARQGERARGGGELARQRG